ncbi:polyprenol phosphomannose-dependent alpha 1,6 mannosyltransferase MptB [Pseudonocardia spinosispora]|uniref:polyprenol phosphomannose-dependent alpha 1,6 mannosyltransferase MptB n=1 Tax=Pseudonocardia spinosispora TaxID=103441 RepID=UPI0009FC2AEA|nr:polyprenol phosphomannose-dependent alpha 1,6 mannosyltransferase MptB [Pseudonocardia spinosispora]
MAAPELSTPRDAARIPATRGLPAPNPYARAVRRFGMTGSLLMAIGSLGAGALPVPNPVSGLRLLGLPARNATVSVAITYAGMAMVVLGWLWLGRLLKRDQNGGTPLAKGFISRTMVLWALPLLVAPPMFSKDVYSYLAQSAIAEHGLDPYVYGPADALGIDDPLTRSIPTIWRPTPAPYGSLFLWLGRGITALTGNDVVLGIFAHRMLAICGIAAIWWALPKLSSRLGLDPRSALWLGVANPLVLFHLFSGVHNESLMLGLMLAGLEIGLSRSWLLGTILITLSCNIKLPAILALGFLGMWIAKERGGRIGDVVKVGLAMLGVSGAVMLAVAYGTGLGFGWINTLDIPTLIRSWVSVSTDLGVVGGQVGILAGMGDHTMSILTLTRVLGGVVAGLICVWLLIGTLRGRIDPITGAGCGLGAVVLLSPTVHPWYLLWAAIPLAASTARIRFRRLSVAGSAIVALLVPPTGADWAFRAYQLPMAILAGAVILFVPLYLVRHRIPR